MLGGMRSEEERQRCSSRIWATRPLLCMLGLFSVQVLVLKLACVRPYASSLAMGTAICIAVPAVSTPLLECWSFGSWKLHPTRQQLGSNQEPWQLCNRLLDMHASH